MAQSEGSQPQTLLTSSPQDSTPSPDPHHEIPETVPKKSTLAGLAKPQHQISDSEASPTTPLAPALLSPGPHDQSPKDSLKASDMMIDSRQRGKNNQTSIWRESWHYIKEKQEPAHHPLVKFKNFLLNISARTWKFLVICGLITVATIGASVGLAFGLEVKDLNTPVPYTGTEAPPVDLAMSLLAIDPIGGTIVLDWYPYVVCPTPFPETYCIYFDPNVSANPNPNQNDPTNTAVADNLVNQKATFCFNPREFCSRSPRKIFATFRTTSKLSSRIADNDHSKASLQAYPFDLYNAQISMYALQGVKGANDTTAELANATEVGIRVSQTWGVVVDFKVELDFTTFISTDNQGTFFILNVRRSGAVRLFVMFIVLTNWLVTIVFLWITIACAFWNEQVVKEVFIVPVSVLFAFTAVRSSMPGSPAGFGAFIDFVGILPNLALLTVCSCILLMLVIHRRIMDHHKTDDKEKTA